MGEVGVHRIYQCVHGVIAQQCRCMGPDKRVVIVDCPPGHDEPVYCGLCGEPRKWCPLCGRVCDCGRNFCNEHGED
jgi:hypothetical protein